MPTKNLSRIIKVKREQILVVLFPLQILKKNGLTQKTRMETFSSYRVYKYGLKCSTICATPSHRPCKNLLIS